MNLFCIFCRLPHFNISFEFKSPKIEKCRRNCPSSTQCHNCKNCWMCSFCTSCNSPRRECNQCKICIGSRAGCIRCCGCEWKRIETQQLETNTTILFLVKFNYRIIVKVECHLMWIKIPYNLLDIARNVLWRTKIRNKFFY